MSTMNMNAGMTLPGIDVDQIISKISASVMGEKHLERAAEKSLCQTYTVRPEKIAGFTMWDTANITAARILLGINPDHKTQMREINKVKIAYRGTITPENIDALRKNKAKWGQFLSYIQKGDGTHTQEQVDVIFGPHEKEAKYHLMGLLMQQNLFTLAPVEKAPEAHAPVITQRALPTMTAVPKAIVPQAKPITLNARSTNAFDAPKTAIAPKPISFPKAAKEMPVRTKIVNTPEVAVKQEKLDNKKLQSVSFAVAQQNMFAALRRYTALPVGVVF